VIIVHRVDRVADAIHIGRRALHIARQSVLAGMGLSIAAMGIAANGHLPPVAGALLQELIDLAVILNALRALRALRGLIRASPTGSASATVTTRWQVARASTGVGPA
jgi:cation transport ATPase